MSARTVQDLLFLQRIEPCAFAGRSYFFKLKQHADLQYITKYKTKTLIHFLPQSLKRPNQLALTQAFYAIEPNVPRITY